MSAVLFHHDGIVVLCPRFVIVFLRAGVELHEPAGIFQPADGFPIEITPSLHLCHVLVNGGNLLVQVLYTCLQILIGLHQSIGRQLFMHLFFRLFVRQGVHALKHILVERTLLHESLQGVVHLAALPFHNVHHAQFPDLCQKCFVLLMIHKERELLHFRNHASASFLFS